MSSRNIIALLVAIIGAAGVIIAALISGIFVLLAAQTQTNANATNVAATFVAQRTVDAPVLPQPYTAQPTFTRLPTQQPYTLIPTPKPNVTVVTPKPFIVTATPSADQQNPPPGSIIPAGQGYARKGVTVLAKKSLRVVYSQISPLFEISNDSNEQIYILWKPAFIRVRDDRGKNYPYKGDDADKTQQFSLSAGKTGTIEAYWTGIGYSWGFKGPIDPVAKYLIVTFDQIYGMTNLSWRYEIQ